MWNCWLGWSVVANDDVWSTWKCNLQSQSETEGTFDVCKTQQPSSLNHWNLWKRNCFNAERHFHWRKWDLKCDETWLCWALYVLLTESKAIPTIFSHFFWRKASAGRENAQTCTSRLLWKHSCYCRCHFQRILLYFAISAHFLVKFFIAGAILCSVSAWMGWPCEGMATSGACPR